jgi:hypothetical protein
MQPIRLDRVQHTCPVCPGAIGTHIIAVWLCLTRVYLETECPVCGHTAARCFDLLEVDKWLLMLDAGAPELTNPLAEAFQQNCGSLDAVTRLKVQAQLLGFTLVPATA